MINQPVGIGGIKLLWRRRFARLGLVEKTPADGDEVVRTLIGCRALGRGYAARGPSMRVKEISVISSSAAAVDLALP